MLTTFLVIQNSNFILDQNLGLDVGQNLGPNLWRKGQKLAKEGSLDLLLQKETFVGIEG